MASSTTVQSTALQNMQSQSLLRSTTGMAGYDNSISVPRPLETVLPEPEGPLSRTLDHCNSNTIELIYSLMHKYLRKVKSLEQLQMLVAKRDLPCLFSGAHLFGGSKCHDQCFNGICIFHWSMLNMRVSVMEGFTVLDSIKKQDRAGQYRQYELLVNRPIEDRYFLPIFPFIDKNTTVYDLLFGFSFATDYGLETTKLNEGAAMAYALYYMLNSRCQTSWQARASHWRESMSYYLASLNLYNEYVSRAERANAGLANQQLPETLPSEIPTMLEKYFAKHVLKRRVNFQSDAPRVHGTPKDVRDVQQIIESASASTLVDLNPGATVGQSAPTGTPADTAQEEDEGELIPYYSMSIFMAPLILGLRASTNVYVKHATTVAASNPNVTIMEMKFRNNVTSSVFVMEGPLYYGVADDNVEGLLTFTDSLPRTTLSYVATLGAITNVEPYVRRVYGGPTATNLEYTLTVDKASDSPTFKMIQQQIKYV